jgi:hypothetical protein
MLRSASATRSGILATVVGIGTVIIAATAVLGELQSALNLIWKAPPAGGLGVWHLVKSRLVGLSVILVIGFLLGFTRDQHRIGGIQRLIISIGSYRGSRPFCTSSIWYSPSIDLRRRRCVDNHLGMGLLFGPDPPARRRVRESLHRLETGVSLSAASHQRCDLNPTAGQ